MGDQIPPYKWDQDLIVKRTLMSDGFFALGLAGVTVFDNKTAAAGCGIVAIMNFLSALRAPVIRWEEGLPEMTKGRLAVLGLATIWLVAGLGLLAVRLV